MASSPQRAILLGGPADLTRMSVPHDRRDIEVPYFTGRNMVSLVGGDINWRDAVAPVQYSTARYRKTGERYEGGHVAESIFTFCSA
jgi:hypothetical protein